MTSEFQNPSKVFYKVPPVFHFKGSKCLQEKRFQRWEFPIPLPSDFIQQKYLYEPDHWQEHDQFFEQTGDND